MDRFITKAEWRARQNLQKFCDEMRERNPYEGVTWDEITWVVGGSRRGSSRLIERLNFTRHAETSSDDMKMGGAFLADFADFSRAIVIWRAINARKRPTALTQMVLVRALRYVYEELRKSSGPLEAVRIDLLRPFHLDSAVQELLRREAESSCYRVANYFQYIAAQIDRLGLAPSALQWKHSVPRPEVSGGLKSDRVSRDFHERRAAKLPTDEVLYFVADVSRRDDLSVPDLVRQRIVDLLFCGGFRINECLTLRRDALIEEPLFDDLGQRVMGKGGESNPVRVGIRYLPEKDEDGLPRTKWIPSDLVPIALRAFRDLSAITHEFAESAKFAFQNPGRVKLGEPWDSLDEMAFVGNGEVMAMVGLANLSSTNSWIEANVTNAVKRNGKYVCRKGDVERALASLSEERGVEVNGVGVPFHELLAIVPINFFHSKKATIRGTAVLISDQNVSDYLCGRGKVGARVNSIFERLEARDSSGRLIRISTHQFRHFLDTVAATGGVSELIRARWMGRRDVSQNSAYDHETGVSLAKKVRERLVQGGVVGPLGDFVFRIADPVEREEVAGDLVRAVHKTRLGRCFHDWAASPCPEHEACWGCDEHLVVKGEPGALDEASLQLGEVTQALRLASEERVSGTYGADNWELSHQRKKDRLEKIIAIHLDPTTPDGTIVHMKRDAR